MIPKKLTHDSTMFIGPSKGKKMSEVSAAELIARLKVGKAYGPLKEYIESNMEELKKRATKEII